MHTSIMVEGLKSKDLDPRFAEEVAVLMCKKATDDDIPLSTAYCQILHARVNPEVPLENEDTWRPPTQGEVHDEDEADALPAPKMQDPYPVI